METKRAAARPFPFWRRGPKKLKPDPTSQGRALGDDLLDFRLGFDGLDCARVVQHDRDRLLGVEVELRQLDRTNAAVFVRVEVVRAIRQIDGTRPLRVFVRLTIAFGRP